MSKEKKDRTQNPDSQSQQQQTSQTSDKKTANQDQQLTKEDIPESTNESRGTTGSGQRQDSN